MYVTSRVLDLCNNQADWIILALIGSVDIIHSHIRLAKTEQRF